MIMEIFYFSWRNEILIQLVIDLHYIVCFINLTWRYLDFNNTYEITYEYFFPNRERFAYIPLNSIKLI